MSNLPQENASPGSTIESCGDACRKAGIRLTPQRLEILRELICAVDHPSADDLHNRLKRRMPTVSLDTVYRTLTTFEQCGVALKVRRLTDRARYDGNLAVHHHLVCPQCNKIQDIYWPEFDQMLMPPETAEWGEVSSRHVELRGLCKKCRGREGGES